ncbi:MAG TPA: hypothetical protein VFY67_01165 [Pyrinomonadaceae bacterium]|nr:hypothetical protein [Pyrinomonadaceae bacterium]
MAPSLYGPLTGRVRVQRMECSAGKCLIMTGDIDTPDQFRIGITVDSFVQPQWVRRSIEKILETGIASLEVIIEAPPRCSSTSFLYKVYKRVDRALFTPEPDALEPVPIDDLFGSARRVTAEELDQIKAADLDVVLNLAPAELNAKFVDTAKHGVWFYNFGCDESDEAGFRELMTEDPLTLSSLRAVDNCQTPERVIYQSVSPTLSRFSVGLNNNQCYWKSAAFVARALMDLHQCRNSSALSQAAKAAAGKDLSLVPTNLATAQALFKLAGRAASRVREKYSYFEQWILAYRFANTDFKYLIPPAGHFWADPFPVEVSGKRYIFFEDYLLSQHKAHISVIEVDENGIVSGPTEALNLDCHLSYPFIFEWEGEHYMIPETGSRNAVELYRSASFPFAWRLDQVLLEANQPLDATLIQFEGRWWMFVNIQEEGVSVNWDELHVYYADSPRGPWRPHARNPVVSDVRSARPAGRLFWSKDSLYRPGQDSSRRYGYATTINRITKLTPTEYSETEVAKLVPTWDKDIVGVHTWNTSPGMTTIDCLVKRRRSTKERRFAQPPFLRDSLNLW